MLGQGSRCGVSAWSPVRLLLAPEAGGRADLDSRAVQGQSRRQGIFESILMPSS